MAKHERFDPKAEVAFIKAMRAQIAALTDDEEVIKDTLQAEVDVDKVMGTLIHLVKEQEALAEGRKALAAQYAEAAKANEERAERLKAFTKACLDAAGEKKWSGVAGTAYIRQGGISTEITDASMVPLEFQKAVPSVSKIKEALQRGEAVPGAQLVKGEDSLTILLPRRKST
jgi:hypothetical protein